MTLDGCLPSLSVKRGAGYAAVRRAAGGRNVEGIVNTKGGAFRNHVDSAAFEGAVSLAAPPSRVAPIPHLASPHLTDMRVFSRARSGAFRRRVSRTLANTSWSTVSCRDTPARHPAVYDVVSEYRGYSDSLSRSSANVSPPPICFPAAPTGRSTLHLTNCRELQSI